MYQKTAAEETPDIIKFKSPSTEAYEGLMPISKEKMKKRVNIIPLAFVLLIVLAVILVVTKLW